MDINAIKYRKEPVKYSKIEETENMSNVVNSNKVKLYEYYICDYCGEQIRIDLNPIERKGEVFVFPHTLTKCGKLKVALCNKCLNKAVKQFEELK